MVVVVIIGGQVAVEIGVGNTVVVVGGGEDESEDGEVLSKRVDGVADDGELAATGAGEGGVGGGGKHSRKTLLTEAVAALEEEWDPLFLVVPCLAD